MSELPTGSRALLIAPPFFGYDDDIAFELERRGATVDRLQDRPFGSATMKAAAKLAPRIISAGLDRFYSGQLEALSSRDYRIILVVNGQTLSARMLRELRNSFPKARLVLYMWDSLANRSSVTARLAAFDDCLTFDPDDAREYSLRFRPLFFSRDFQRPVGKAKYDISFVGTAHTDRYAIVSRVQRSLPLTARYYWYLYLQAPWVFQFHRLSNKAFRAARIEEFHFTPLSRADVRDVFFSSRTVLDIEHPNQKGLTIRTFEAMGASKKVVTTNRRIADYDFYRPENVQILDRAAGGVNEHFLEEPYKPLADTLYRKYSICGWMDDVIG